MMSSKGGTPLRVVTGAVFLLAAALGQDSLANPPGVPVSRSKLPEIERDLKDMDPKVQWRALGLLPQVEGDLKIDLVRLMPRIIQLCQSPDSDVSQSALSIVAQFCWIPEARREHGRVMVEAIGKALKSKDADVRRLAAYAIWQAGQHQLVDEQLETALPILIAAADDREERVRVQIMLALGAMRKADAQVVTALRRALADPDMQVRRFAALALAEHARISEAAIPDLLTALRDPAGQVSGSAAHALGKMGETAMEALLKATDAPDAAVRRLAISALGSGHVGRYSKEDKSFKRIAAMVHRKLDDSDAAVRGEAAVRVSIFGSLEARVAAIPILVKNATGKESLDGLNASLGIGRCIREFVSGLTDKDQAETAFRGLKQFEKDWLKGYLQQSHEKFRSVEGGDVRPLLKSAAEQGSSPMHREFAAEMLSWLPEDKDH